ncbi:MAG: sigma-70 family RNA polymerase sigma factor [Mariprofundaceae bacterium]|nr:sigma-70 family RNA polymerase sigma factor [Mariprofundaceae bacterium]
MSKDSGKQKTHDPQQWLAEYGDYLFRFALFRLSDNEIAKDMVQETLIAAWKAKKNFRGDSSLRTWLVGIMKHKITDHIRKEIRGRKLSDALEHDPTSSMFDQNDHWAKPVQGWEDDPERLCSNQQFLKALHHCVAALPEQHRNVFTLRELNGEDTDSICNALDISSTNLHVIMHRARLALRQCLEKNWFGNGKDE